MKLKDQVCSLELAKKLKKLGIKQNAYWSWYENAGEGHLMHHEDGWRSFESKTFDAFTSSELGEMLPSYVNENSFTAFKIDEQYHITYSTKEKWWHREVDNNEADARAKMLIYLLENKLINLQ